MIQPGQVLPNLVFSRPDGTSLELADLRKREFALLLFLKGPHPDTLAFITRFQEEARLFEWLNARLVPVFPERGLIPSPWPAPGYPPCLHPQPLLEGLEWERGYLLSKLGALLTVYEEPSFLSAHKIETDLYYYDRGVC